MKKVAGRIATVVLITIISGVAFVYFHPDYNMYLVRSESMVPAIGMGDMVITGPMNGPLGGGVKEGNIITYYRGAELVTHRVLSVDGDALMTKGDAVEDADPWSVSLSDVKGVYLFRIPQLGYFSNFIRTRLGWLLLIVIPASVLVGLLFRDINKRIKNSREEAL